MRDNQYIVGGDKLRRRLESVSRTDRMLYALQTKVVRVARNNTRPFRKTGNLGRTIKAGYLTKTDATVVAHAPYARYVEEGTGIYGPKHRPIVPKRAGALAFHSQAAGRERFGIKYRLSGNMTKASERKYGPGADFVVVKSVRGRKATPFMRPAVDTAKKDMGLDKVVIDLWNEGA